MWVKVTDVTGRFKVPPSGGVSGNTEWQVNKQVPSAGKTPVKIKAVPSRPEQLKSQTEPKQQKVKLCKR